MKQGNIAFGQLGEEIAFHFLRRKGYRLLARNWKAGKLEIDLVFRHAAEIVFVEVKTRATDTFGYPELAVTEAKQRRVANAANAFLQEHGALEYEAVRFDIMAIVKNEGEQRIYHIEDAFYPRV